MPVHLHVHTHTAVHMPNAASVAPGILSHPLRTCGRTRVVDACDGCASSQARGAGGALRHSHYLPAHSGVRLFRVPHTLRTTLVSRKGVRAFGTGQDSSCMRLRASLGRRHCSMAFDVMVYMFASMAFTTVQLYLLSRGTSALPYGTRLYVAAAPGRPAGVL